MKFIDINTNDLFYFLGEASFYLSQSVEWDGSFDETESIRNCRLEDENLWNKEVEMSFSEEEEDNDDDEYSEFEDDEDEDEDEDDDWEDDEDDEDDDEEMKAPVIPQG